MLVKAIRLGFYKNRRRKPGVTFEIDSEKEFSKRWMKKVEAEDSTEKPEEEVLSEKDLMKLNKDDLIAKATELGLEVDESLTKAGIMNLILSKDGGN